MKAPKELRVVRAADVSAPDSGEARWLIESLWGAGAVGVVGGPPKSCKTWLALEMAVAVASGKLCLGRFTVPKPGPVLVYAAEDAPVQVRERLEDLARARGTDLGSLEIRLILEPELRLDRPEDLTRLRLTLDRHRPRLLILDPYVRLQSSDENNATEVARVLGALRALSRMFGCAILLVHHARKNPADHDGQALRGSGDFWAWGDSNLYVRRRRDGVLLSIEHRAAPAPPPVMLTLLSPEDGPVHLEVRDAPRSPEELPLPQRILGLLAEREPRRKEELREVLRVRNQLLAEALRELEASGQIVRGADGWRLRNGH
jgi:hypothetical protein